MNAESCGGSGSIALVLCGQMDSSVCMIFVCDGGTGGEEQPGLSLTDLAPATSLNVFVQTFLYEKRKF